MSSRLEPIIDQAFVKVRPAPVPRYQAFPYNDDIQYNYTVLYDELSPVESDLLLSHNLSLNEDPQRKLSTSSAKRNTSYKEKADSKALLLLSFSLLLILSLILQHSYLLI